MNKEYMIIISRPMCDETETHFCNRNDLKNYDTYAEYCSIYKIGKEMSLREKIRIGLKSFK